MSDSIQESKREFQPLFTEREIQMLKQFAANYDAERRIDSTNDPIVTVQTKSYRMVPEGYGGDRTYLINSGGEYSTVSDQKELIDYFEENGDDYFCEEVEDPDDEDNFVTKVNMEHFNECFDDLFNGFSDEATHPEDSEFTVTVVYQEEVWTPVAFFFSRKEAQEYCKYQSHNLSSPRVYTLYAGYGNNGDYPVFLKMLKRMGEQLLALEGDSNVNK